jgi:hypothetical protein
MMGCGMMGSGEMMGRGMMGGGMMARGMMGPPVMMRMIFSLMDSDGDGPFHWRSFRRLTNEFSREWIATKMAALLRRRCRHSCKGLGDRSSRSRSH